MKKKADVFRALGHPVRIQIVELLLKKKEISTYDLRPIIAGTKNMIGNHLHKLQDAGIITFVHCQDKSLDGHYHIYSLVNPELISRVLSATEPDFL